MTLENLLFSRGKLLTGMFLFIVSNLAAQVHPVITSIAPTSGPAGSTVLINGSNFGITTTRNTVMFGNSIAKVTAASPTQLSVVVPYGSSYQPISVFNISTDMIGYSSVPFRTTFTSKPDINALDFDLPATFASGTAPVQVAVADLNADGKPDILAVNQTTQSVSSYINDVLNGGYLGAGTFLNEGNYGGVANPASVTVGDLNGDGIPDLIVTYKNSTQIRMYVSSAPSVTTYDLGTGTAATSIGDIVITDVDGDGYIDVVAVMKGDAAKTVAVLRNTSNGGLVPTFSESDFYGGNNITSLNTMDLDGDGMPDLVATNNGLSILRNTSSPGNISFVKTDIATTTTPLSALIGDMDADGLPDIVVANGGSVLNPANSTISVYRNLSTTGNINFATNIDFPVLTPNAKLAIGDLNGDGLPDLALTSAQTVQIIRNTTSGSTINFAAGINLYEPNPVSIAIADMNQDGKPDLVTVDFSGNLVEIFQNDPQPDIVNSAPVISSFSPQSAAPGNTVTIDGSNFGTTPLSNVVFFGATKATVTGASNNQLTVTVPSGATCKQISVLNTTTNLSCVANRQFIPTFSAKGTTTDFDPRVNFVTGKAPSALAVADIDGDGNPDIVVVNTASNTFSVFLNANQTGVITTASFKKRIDITTPTNPTYLAVSDINGDGKPDLVVGCKDGNSVNIFINTSSAGTVSFSSPITFSQLTEVSCIGVADVDGDGKPDVIIFTSGGSGYIYRNRTIAGSSTLSFIDDNLTLAADGQPEALTVSDFDGDGKPDISVATGSGNLSFFRNTSSLGKPSFTVSNYTNIGDWPGPLITADIDGDGKPDELFSIYGLDGTNSLVFMPDSSTVGNIKFGAGTYLQGNSGSALAVADINGDGVADVIETNTADNTVGVYNNLSKPGSISLATKMRFATGVYPADVAIADLDGDGKPDLVVANQSDNSISVLHYNPDAIPVPSISSIAPILGVAGTDIIVSGLNLSSATAVTIGGRPAASFTVDTLNRVHAIVGGADLSGTVTVVTPYGSVSWGHFTFVPVPTIVVGGPTTFKSGGSVLLTAKPDTSIFSYQWIKGQDYISGGVNATYAATESGSYRVLLTYYSDQQVSTQIVNVSVILPTSPVITAFTPAAGKAGAVVTISGQNLTGATSVSIGGTPVTSFKVDSLNNIEAVIGTGSSGPITVITPNGTFTYGNFVFVPVPTIVAGGPIAFNQGGSVQLTASPDTSIFSYQWLKDGVAITGATTATYTAVASGLYQVSVDSKGVKQESTQSVYVDVNYSVPANNFTVSITSATCRGSNNGEVTVVAAQPMNYTATLTGAGLNKSLSFADTTVFSSLAAGTYHLCITIQGQSDYQQCFDVTITEPQDLSAYATINDTENTVTLALAGGTLYNINLNSQAYTTTSSFITLPLSPGNNQLTVTTDKPCQGMMQKLINTSGKINPYPVPFQNVLYLNIGDVVVNNISVEIGSVSDGKVVYTKEFANQWGVLTMDVSALRNGVYALHVKTGNEEYVFKIMKR